MLVAHVPCLKTAGLYFLSVCPSVHPSRTHRIPGVGGGSQHQVAQPQHLSMGPAHLRQKGEAKKVGGSERGFGETSGQTDGGVVKSYCVLWSFLGSPRGLGICISPQDWGWNPGLNAHACPWA